MTDQFDERGRDAAAAVRDTTERIRVTGDVDDVMRRGRRRTTVPAVIVVVALAVLAVPAVGWFLDGQEPAGVEVADAPEEDDAEPEVEVPVEDEAPAEPDAGPAPDVDDVPPPVADAGGDEEDEVEPDDEVARGPDAVGDFSLDPVESDGFPDGGAEPVQLTDVRVAGQDGFDRFVLEFDGAQMSPYRIAYVEPPILQDGSGNVVDVDGSAFLEVRLTAASGVVFDAESSDGFRVTYDGPERVAGGDTGVLLEAVRTGDFEATLSWAVGLEERAPFAVTVLDAPLRLVVDIETS